MDMGTHTKEHGDAMCNMRQLIELIMHYDCVGALELLRPSSNIFMEKASLCHPRIANINDRGIL